MQLFISVSLIAYFISSSSAGQVFVPGECPEVPFVKSFNCHDFLGIWIEIWDTGFGTPCVKNTVMKGQDAFYHAFVEPMNAFVKLNSINPVDFSEGFNVSVPANSYIDGGVLKIFATDYGK